jgi:N6-L-threonylcarbamoyladenine synthase
MPIILAIETSCDDTSAAIVKNGKILANIATAQLIHKDWGGIVPELASREHTKLIIPVVNAALEKAALSLSDLDAIAFTKGPGLIGSLMVGVTFAKALALAIHKPLIAVHHMQAHVLANFIDNQPSFPHICLTVSGGHTQIVLVKSPSKMEIIGKTIDDAAGEAFDKVGKLLGLSYPAGAEIDRLSKFGDHTKFKFPKSKVPDFDFSFSGIKTSVMYFLQKENKNNPSFLDENINDICASVQHTLVETLIEKLEAACIQLNIKEISLAGGVSANSYLRQKFEDLGKRKNWKTHIPSFEYCTDNAAMIVITAHFKYLENNFVSQDCEPSSRIDISEW